MATEILADLYGPEFILIRHFHDRFETEPVKARFVAASSTALTGLLKPFLLPLISTLGFILMPILAAKNMVEGSPEGTKAYLQAWGVSTLGLVGSFGIFLLIGYSFPLLWTAALLAGLCALSTIFHVAKAMKTT